VVRRDSPASPHNSKGFAWHTGCEAKPAEYGTKERERNMQPSIHLNWLAIGASVVASFVLGSLWYGPLFGKTWAKDMGYGDKKMAGSEIAKGSILNLLGALLMAFVLAHDVAVWRPSSWHAGADASPYVYGFFAGFFLWIGFVIPMLLNSVAYERKTWKVFGINAVYQFLSLQAMGMILAHLR
jgi:hypothetical protein